MPYKLKSFGKGKYKVCKKNSNKCFSKKPLPKSRAEDQMKAMYASESIELPSGENVVNHEIFQDPHSEEATNILNKYELAGSDIDYLKDLIENGEDIEEILNYEGVTHLSFDKVEHKGSQTHYLFGIENTPYTLEIIFLNGDYKECIISDESKEPADENKESVEESLSFETLYNQIMSK